MDGENACYMVKNENSYYYYGYYEYYCYYLSIFPQFLQILNDGMCINQNLYLW